MSATKIEWADMTKQFVYGCTKCSPGCDNCYAERRAAMLAMHPNHKISTNYACVVDGDGEWTGDIELAPLDFTKLIRARVPRRIFINSMSDTFHPRVPFNFLRKLWLRMEAASQHTFLILTKRHERMWAFISENQPEPLPNVWLGVTVCSQTEADDKIPLLLQTPAAKRFVSVEPMLGPVDLTEYLATANCRYDRDGDIKSYKMLLNWVICGGESGPKARPMHPDWVRVLRDQCKAQGAAFFFKGWGEWYPRSTPLPGAIPTVSPSSIDPKCKKWPCVRLTQSGGNGWNLADVDGGEDIYMQRIGKKRAGRLLDGREWNEVPDVKN